MRISGPRAHGVARAILTVPHDLEPRHATLTHVRAARQPGADPESRIPNPGARGSPDDAAPAHRRGRRHATSRLRTPTPPRTSSRSAPTAAWRCCATSCARPIAAGARLAEPGEFTLRAFLNGRLDLVQAEAVADLVDAVTPLQARVAFDQLEGTLTRAIGAIDRELFDLAARLEASVDFPGRGLSLRRARRSGRRAWPRARRHRRACWPRARAGA
ncbi:MAG: hypothetical protein M0C28_46565 [Candidatus Moduliflexus flocculans]|nr:hypothetical protein [Candidatus Moduliflexus flocculans]